MVGWWKSCGRGEAGLGKGIQWTVHEFLISTSKKRGNQPNEKKPNTLTANATVDDLRQQQAKDGGRCMVIGKLLVEIWGITCVGAEEVECN